LSKGDVDRISGSSLPRTDVSSPAYSLSDWDAKVAESKGAFRMENKGEEKESEKDEFFFNPWANHHLYTPFLYDMNLSNYLFPWEMDSRLTRHIRVVYPRIISMSIPLPDPISPYDPIFY